MAKRIKGYNILLKLNSKKIAGTTANSFGIKPKIKESLIKDDDGISQSEVIGYDSEFSVSGLMILNEGGESSNFEDVGTLRAAAMAGTLIPFVYGDKNSGGKTLIGNLLITDYKEDTDSENIGTYSISCKVSGVLTESTSNSVPLVKTVTLTGTSGSAVITGPGQLVKPVTFSTDLTTTAAAFVTANAAAYATKGITVTSNAAVITFTATSVNVLFDTPVITNVVTNLAGTIG